MARVRPLIVVRDLSGHVVPNADIYIYERDDTEDVTAHSKVPIPLYTAEAGGTEITQPVHTNTRGICEAFWMDTASYDRRVIARGDDYIVSDEALDADGFITSEELDATLELPYANVLTYGADPTGATYSDTAFANALADIPTVNDAHFPDADVSRRGTLFIPAGLYKFADSLELDRSVVLQGSSGSGWFGATLLRFDAGNHGIVVKGYTGDGSDPRGDWSVIRDLVVEANAKTTEAHGIKLEARAKIENCWVYKFKGNGIHIEASIPGPTANNWYVGYCRVDGHDGNGMFVSGNDANAGVAIGVDCSDNDGFGFVDETLLGNTYLACHTSSNVGGGYSKPEAHEVNTSTYIGCYTEGGQDDAIYAPAAMYGRVTGGTSSGDAPVLESYGTSGSFQSEPIVVFTGDGDDADIYIQLGARGSSIVQRIKNDTDGEYVTSWGSHQLVWKHDSSDARKAFALTGTGAAQGAGQAVFDNGVYLGQQTKVLAGNGSPEGVVTAERGWMFLRQDGGANTTLYIKESGSGNTGWVAK